MNLAFCLQNSMVSNTRILIHPYNFEFHGDRPVVYFNKKQLTLKGSPKVSRWKSEKKSYFMDFVKVSRYEYEIKVLNLRSRYRVVDL